MYNALWRKPEAKVIPLCVANGIGQIVWSPLAQGVLTGKYFPGQPPPADSRAAHPEMSEYWRDYLRSDAALTTVQDLRPIAARLDLTIGPLALAWALRLHEVSSAIVGASRPEQLDENAAAAGVILPQDALDDIGGVLAPLLATIKRTQPLTN